MVAYASFLLHLPQPMASAGHHPNVPAPEVWKALVAALPDVPQNTATAHKAATRDLGRAMRVGNEAGVKDALIRGGMPDTSAEQHELLNDCLTRRLWGVARALITAGISTQCSPWATLARDDRIEDVVEMGALGLPISQATLDDLMQAGAVHLVEVWLATVQPTDAHLEKLVKSVQSLVPWFTTALAAASEVGDALHRVCGLDLLVVQPPWVNPLPPSTDPFAFNELDIFWWTIIDNDDLDLARAAVERGWVPRNTVIKDQDSLPFVWRALENEAWDLLAWWMAVPELKNTSLQQAQNSPAYTWWPSCGPNEGAKKLKWVMSMGIDVAWADVHGRTLADEALDSDFFNFSGCFLREREGVLKLVEWTNCVYLRSPLLLFHPGQSGVAPIEGMASAIESAMKSEDTGSGLKEAIAHLNSLQLEHGLNRHAAPCTIPRRRRKRL